MMNGALSLIALAAAAALTPPQDGDAEPVKTTRMADSAEASVKPHIENLMADYGFTADRRDAVKVADYFTTDGTLFVPSAGVEVTGREAITKVFGGAWKAVGEAGQQRRHAITGMRLLGHDNGTYRFRAIMTVTGTPAEGRPQVYLTGYYLGEAVETDKGWRLRRLEIHVDMPGA